MSIAALPDPLTEKGLEGLMRDKRYWHPKQRDPAYQRLVERGFKLMYPTVEYDAAGRLLRSPPREGRLADLESDYARLNSKASSGAGGEVEVHAYHQDRAGQDVSVRAHTRARPGGATAGGSKAEPAQFNPFDKNPTLLRRDGSPKPDLGPTGNLAREFAGSDYAERLFEHWWSGEGDMELERDRFDTAVKYAEEHKDDRSVIRKTEMVVSPDGEELTRKTVRFYNNPELAGAFGDASIFYDKEGKAVGFYDLYNMNKRDWTGEESRTFWKEAGVRIARKAGLNHGAKDYHISFGKFVKP